MKKLILFPALLSLAFTSFAQTAAQDSTLIYPVTVQDARFEVAAMPPGSSGIIAICKALKGVTDSTATVNVVVTQNELVLVAENNRRLPEGLAADINARLYATVLSLLPSRPWLYEKMMLIKSDNLKQQTDRAAAGAEIIRQNLEAWNRK